MPIRPIQQTFMNTPWIANEPVGATPVRDIVPKQVQVAFEGTGRMSERNLVPMTPAATDLLNGPHRDAAQQFFRGVLGQLDGLEGVTKLDGMSLSTDHNAFATNLMMSNIDNGFFRDTISTGQVKEFLGDFQMAADQVTGMRAQNSGWLDVGPRVSGQVMDLIKYGPRAGREAMDEAGLVLTHEIQHSITPIKPNVDQKLLWLEEGSAEALAWWPGATKNLLNDAGVPTAPGYEISPHTAPRNIQASPKYRNYHTAVLKLLDLAGAPMFDAAGNISQDGTQKARQILQGENLEQVPKNLAHAIGNNQGMAPGDVDALTALIADSGGERTNIEAIQQLVAAH